MTVSIVITAMNDNYYLEKILSDVIKQDYDHSKIELILIEAGGYRNEKVIQMFQSSKIDLKYIHKKNISRNNALNEAFKLAQNDLIVRLDARTHIESNYLKSLKSLSGSTGASVVGGVKVPIGETPKQKLIAKVMSHPFLLGGAKTRRLNFEGYADTVYLGAYIREKIQNKFKFDNNYERISEDADLNYQINKSGQQIYISSKIKAYYYPRETILKFVKLMFGYGISSGLFIRKNKTFKPRQAALPLAAMILLLSLSLSMFSNFFLYLFIFIIFSYFFTISIFSISISRLQIRSFASVLFLFISTHVMWMIGLVYSLFIREKKQ